MGLKEVREVFERSKSKGPARLVLVAIASRLNEHGKAWPSSQTLQTECNMSRSSVQAAIQSLVESGELKREINAGPHNSNLYSLNLPALAKDSDLEFILRETLIGFLKNTSFKNQALWKSKLESPPARGHSKYRRDSINDMIELFLDGYTIHEISKCKFQKNDGSEECPSIATVTYHLRDILKRIKYK